MDAISMNMNYVAQKKKFNFNEGAKAVSYTHLDVYKRQVIFNYSTITSTSQSQRWDATIKIN